LKQHTGAELHNVGQLPRDQVLALYKDARALIFPSTTESFGLPLIEAQHLGLPVLAPEADYVRDVCVPSQTFDPLSAVSIARAVRRFLGQVEPVLHVGLPSDFWAAVQAPHDTDKAG
jgi:glycosyltransferase involved in cell wall biosynthesis